MKSINFIKKLLDINATAKEIRKESWRVSMLYMISIIGIIFLCYFGFDSFSRGFYKIVIFDIVTFIVLLSNLIYLRIKKNYIVSARILSVITLLLFEYLFFKGNANNGLFFWLTAYPALAIFLMGQKEGKYWTLSALLLSFIIFYFHLKTKVEPNYLPVFYIKFVGVYLFINGILYIYESAYRKSEEILRENENKYRFLFQESFSLNIITSLNGKIIDINKVFLELLGYKKSEVLNKDIQKFVIPKQRKMVMEKFNKALIKEQTDQLQIELLKKGKGTRIVLFAGKNVILYKKDQPVGVLFSAIDITELHQAVEKLKRIQMQLIQTEKMAGIGQLASGIAHEVNNPIGYIINNLSILNGYVNAINKSIKRYEEFIFDNLSKNQKQYTYTKEAVIKIKETFDLDYVLKDIKALSKESLNGANQIKNIVANLKNFAHPSQEKMILTDINQEMENAILLVWNELKRKCTIKKRYNRIPKLLCFQGQIKQIFVNLLINSLHAFDDDSGVIQISTYTKGNYIYIEITDNGKGIPKYFLPKVFDPFFTTKEIGKGTGLGLSIVYGIIKNHKGKIKVKSTAGKGTTFIISLPKKSK